MKKWLLLVLLLSCVFILAATPGSAEDPLVTKSWVDSYLNKVVGEAESKLDALTDELDGKNINLWIGKTSATVNGTAKTLEVAPLLSNGRTMVPLRFIGECFGAVFVWDNSLKHVTYTKGVTKVGLCINQKNIVVNGVSVATDVPAVLVNNRTMVPLRVISESFGAKVNWISSEKRVNIIYED